jgi:hypothetical protein
MRSLIEGLPPEIASQIHPDWRKNEVEYWAVRDSLLQQYRDQWVAFADGAVIASGRIPVDVFHDGQASGRHPYVACVGHEYEPARIRRTTFPYDKTYPVEALPVVSVEFRTDPVVLPGVFFAYGGDGRQSRNSTICRKSLWTMLYKGWSAVMPCKPVFSARATNNASYTARP